MPYPLVLFDSIAGRARAVAPTLREARSQAPLVVLDLRDRAFMDRSGVRAIVDASIRAREFGRRLVLLRPRHLDRLFAVTGSSGDVESGSVDRVEPTVEALPPREARVARIRRLRPAARHPLPPTGLEQMRTIKPTFHRLEQRRMRRAALSWAELEAEAARQGCSAADVFVDRAGRRVPGLPILSDAAAAGDPAFAPTPREARAGDHVEPTYGTGGSRA